MQKWPISERSTQIVPIDTPANLYSSHAADTAKHVAGHESDFASYPPSNPAQDRRADKNAEFVHVFSSKNNTQ